MVEENACPHDIKKQVTGGVSGWRGGKTSRQGKGEQGVTRAVRGAHLVALSEEVTRMGGVVTHAARHSQHVLHKALLQQCWAWGCEQAEGDEQAG